MNKSAFLKLIKQVSDISDQQQSELEQVAATFPYCQTAHLLLAKSAYDRGSMLSTQRLRRASAYATDRQLLKRIIYAAPVLEPVYEAEAQEAAVADGAAFTTADTPALLDTETEITVADQLITEDTEVLEAIPEPEATHKEEETLEEVYTPAPVEASAYPADEATEPDSETLDAAIDSELALLFTFNSISSSSTDLLTQRETDAEEPANTQQAPEHDPTAETAGALHHLEEVQEIEVQEEDPAAGAAEAGFAVEVQAIPAQQAEPFRDSATDAETPFELTETDAAGIIAEEEHDTPAADAEDAEINYSFDEIDRLYAEDALGYWMGSSRMGEVLQLKDDYTRSRPQSFHPELILEYSKTHELEKAIQPTAHVLSKQLDIIDQFLKLNPKLKTMASLKLKPEPQEDLSLKSSKIKKGMATESLANIFVQQGKPKKAVKIYEQLILKYPEKKSYFAEQIEKLQNIT